MSDTLLHKARNIYEQQTHNRRMTGMFILLFIITFLTIGIGFDFYFGISPVKSLFVLPMLFLAIGSTVWSLQGKTGIHLNDSKWLDWKVEFDLETVALKVAIGMAITVFVILCLWFYHLHTRIMELTQSRMPTPDFFLFFVRVFEFLDAPILKVIPWGTAITIFLTIILTITSLRWGSRSIVWSLNPLPSDILPEQYALLRNVVTEMSLAAGIPSPSAAVIDDDDPNAFATGTTYSNSTVVVTTGLLKALTREELQGVISHEISHIRNNDTQVLTVVTVLFGAILLLSEWMRKIVFLGGTRGIRVGGASMVVRIVFFFGWLLTFIFAPLIARILAMSVSRQREYLADASGAELTRNPIALACALSKIENHADPTRSIPKSIAHFCVVDPLGRKVNSKEGFWANLLATHPPIQKRIMFLRTMAYQSPVHSK